MINTAEKRFADGTEERIMFNDFWKLCQSFWVPEDTDEYWKKLHDAAVAFGNVHGKFAMKLALAYISEMERKLKENNGK